MVMAAAGEMHRDGELWPLLLEAVSVHNVLPLTSSCNMNCVFCSHRGNPPSVQTFSFPPLSLPLLRELIPFLDGNRKIVIGESTTRLCEGEPLTHPHLMPVLKEIREIFPRAPLQLTTNASLLRRDVVKELAAIFFRGGLELVISLNCISKEMRAEVMGDPKPGEALRGVALLEEESISFHGSVVALPHLTGWEELQKTLVFLKEAGALTSRIFLPGFTRFTSTEKLCFSSSTWKEVLVFLRELAEQIEYTLIPEPPFKEDLQATVEGVIASTPASRDGIRRGDIIKKVDGREVFSGVEAFFKIRDSADPLLEIRRVSSGVEGGVGGAKNYFQGKEFSLTKKAGETSGLVIFYDLPSNTVDDVRREIRRHRAVSPLLMTSRAAAPLWKAVLRGGFLPTATGLEIVENHFWGGTICCAGLLTVSDIELHLQRLPSGAEGPDLVIIPISPFDRQGRDLLGRSREELPLLLPQVSFSFL